MFTEMEHVLINRTIKATPEAVRGQLNVLDMDIKDMIKKNLEYLAKLSERSSRGIKELKEAGEKHARGEISDEELEAIIDEQEAYAKEFDRVIAESEKRLDELSERLKACRNFAKDKKNWN